MPRGLPETVGGPAHSQCSRAPRDSQAAPAECQKPPTCVRAPGAPVCGPELHPPALPPAAPAGAAAPPGPPAASPAPAAAPRPAAWLRAGCGPGCPSPCRTRGGGAEGAARAPFTREDGHATVLARNHRLPSSEARASRKPSSPCTWPTHLLHISLEPTLSSKENPHVLLPHPAHLEAQRNGWKPRHWVKRPGQVPETCGQHCRQLCWPTSPGKAPLQQPCPSDRKSVV